MTASRDASVVTVLGESVMNDMNDMTDTTEGSEVRNWSRHGASWLRPNTRGHEAISAALTAAQPCATANDGRQAEPDHG
jgi:hypothetical protein